MHGAARILQRRPGWGGGKANATTLSLAPLAPAETEQLIAGFLSKDALAEQQRSQVVAQSEGRPLFVREYVRMLRDTNQGRRSATVRKAPLFRGRSTV